MTELSADPKRAPQHVKAKWSPPDADLQTAFVQHAQIAGLGSELYVTFGQVQPPMVDDLSEEKVSASIKPVVRLVMTPDALRQIAKMLSRIAEGMDSDG